MHLYNIGQARKHIRLGNLEHSTPSYPLISGICLDSKHSTTPVPSLFPGIRITGQPFGRSRFSALANYDISYGVENHWVIYRKKEGKKREKKKRKEKTASVSPIIGMFPIILYSTSIPQFYFPLLSSSVNSPSPFLEISWRHSYQLALTSSYLLLELRLFAFYLISLVHALGPSLLFITTL